MDSLFFRWLRRQGLIALALVLPCVAYAQNGTMPNVVPVSTQPLGPAPGGGVLTRVTYEMRLAEAANGGAGVAANAASYVSRPVTIAGPTMGGIVRGVVAGGSRLVPWVAAALTAYEVYQWYTKPDGQLYAPGITVNGQSCVAGGSYFDTNGSIGCSAPGAAAAAEAAYLRMYTYIVSYRITQCMPAQNGSCYASARAVDNTQQVFNSQVETHWYSKGAPSNLTDLPYHYDPTPVTDARLGDLAQQHPEWWSDMLRDPQTGQPLVTPEIADDMDALKHQIAPRYGVDPQTLPQTQPDPDYLHGNATPREQSLPGYCAWATAACDYYKFVQDQWPDKKHQIDPDNGCGSPMPACSGDAVLCAIAANTRAMKCGSGDDTPPDNDPGSRRVEELIQPDVDAGDTSRLDSGGFGWGTACPFNDLQIEMGGQTVTVSVKPVCDYGPWMRAFILILAGLQCARIMAGLKDADGA